MIAWLRMSAWLHNVDNSLINEVLFLDLKKAFDTDDDRVLISKLEYA
jgi:hypothetical protein